MMNRKLLVVLVLTGIANAALAEDSGLSVSLGVRAWQTQWTTFSYYPGIKDQPNLALTQVSAQDELTVIPVVSVRYRNFLGSISGLPSTNFVFDDGSRGEREEFDVNVGYFILPTLAATVGYKQVTQKGDGARYRPAGPVVGLSGNAPLGGPWSLYGTLGVGWLKTPGGDDIKFDADYRLADLGVAYTLSTGKPRSWTLTGGYRIQVMDSKEAFQSLDGYSQDGKDTTQGFTLGVMATF